MHRKRACFDSQASISSDTFLKETQVHLRLGSQASISFNLFLKVLKDSQCLHPQVSECTCCSVVADRSMANPTLANKTPTFVPPSTEELATAMLVGIDAEFVALTAEETELLLDGKYSHESYFYVCAYCARACVCVCVRM